MKYNLLFLDMDGTLKKEPNDISAVNKETIALACKANIKIMIASGRSKELILPTVKELQLDQYGDSFTVALNGAHIIDNRTGNTLKTQEISRDIIYELFNYAYELEISCHVYTESYIYFSSINRLFRWYQKGGCISKLIDWERVDMGIEEPPLKLFLSHENREKLIAFQKLMEEKTKGILNAEFSTANSLEYTSVKASKGLGMEYICRLLDQPLSEAIAVGDGENDISMLQMAGLGIAMKNALDTVKKAADTVTEHTCIENGVSEVIHKYFLNT